MSAADEHARYVAVVAGAQRKLDAAIEEFFSTCEYTGVMTSWVLVAHHTTMVEERNASSYGVVTMNDSQPSHVVEGLLRQGIRDIEESMYFAGGFEDGDDDE